MRFRGAIQTWWLWHSSGTCMPGDSETLFSLYSYWQGKENPCASNTHFGAEKPSPPGTRWFWYIYSCIFSDTGLLWVMDIYTLLITLLYVYAWYTVRHPAMKGTYMDCGCSSILLTKILVFIPVPLKICLLYKCLYFKVCLMRGSTACYSTAISWSYTHPRNKPTSLLKHIGSLIA